MEVINETDEEIVYDIDTGTRDPERIKIAVAVGGGARVSFVEILPHHHRHTHTFRKNDQPVAGVSTDDSLPNTITLSRNGNDYDVNVDPG